MNNPKLLRMASYRTKRTEESNIVNFIDRLPHITKDDKMLLRKKAKDVDPTLLEILKKRNVYHFRDDEDFKRIEATIRKYLNDIKQSAKEQQINKYKNNLKSYRSSCEKPHNKENSLVEKKTLFLDNNRFQRNIQKSARSPTSSLQKLHDLKNLKSNRPMYHTQRLDSLKAKYSMDKQKYRNLHTNIQLNAKSKMRSSKLLSGSSSTKNLTKKQVLFDPNLNIKTEIPQVSAKCDTDRHITQMTQSSKNNPRIIPEFQNLFTPPDLLRECKLILEQSKQSPPFEIVNNNFTQLASTSVSPKFNSANNELIQYLCKGPKALPQQKQALSNAQTVSFCKQESDSNLLDNNLRKQNDQKNVQKCEKMDFQTKTAQFVFDCLFSDCHQIAFRQFSQIINRSFSSPLQLYRLFQKADANHSGSVTIYEMGKCLQESCGSEQNYIKDIFELLDMDRKGFITETDITNFVHQIVDSSCQDEGVVKQMFMRVLFESDFKNNGKIQYWALYFTKGLECFKEMVVYISQFQFEVQC